MGHILDFAACFACIAAGAYLLQYNSVGGNSWFQIIGHGMGIYFLGKGVYVGRSAYLQSEQHDRLKELVEAAKRADGNPS